MCLCVKKCRVFNYWSKFVINFNKKQHVKINKITPSPFVSNG
jgi:hypothetical protein